MTYRFAPALPAACQPGRVSAVVVYHSGEADLRRCVASLAAQELPDLEIVVVDNGSEDGAPARLGPGVRRLRLPRNLGFPGGANAGLLAATGEHLLLLNPDAELEPGCVAALMHAGAHIAAPRILLSDDPDRLENCGHLLFPDGLNWCRGRGELAHGRFEAPEELLLFSGAAVLVARSALVRTGLFDPSYFGYGEDADLGLRAAARGLICRYVPGAVVRHRVGGSFGRLALRKVFLVERNRIRVAVTHLPWRWLLVSPMWTVARHAILARGAVSGTGLASSWEPGRRSLLPAVVLAAQVAGLARLPGSLRRRRALRARVSISRLRSARAGLADLARRPPGV
jgi:GT2 family glycosyltransferase